MTRLPNIPAHAAAIAIGCIGVLVTALALGLLVLPTTAFVAPFASTAALKYSAPDNPMTRPRAVIGGHLLGAIAGAVLGQLIGGAIVGAAIAASVAMVLMLSTHTMHPPAAAVAIIAFQHPDHPWDSIAAVAIAGTVTVACAVVLYRLLHRRSYPLLSWSRTEPAPQVT